MAHLAPRRRPLPTSRLGGPVGRHASRLGGWFTAGPWAVGLALVSWLVLWARQLPCRQATTADIPNAFYRLCYSDIPVLFKSRHMGQSVDVYGMEYPVGTGALISLSRRLAGMLGAVLGPGSTGQAEVDGANIYFAVTSVLLFAFFVVTVLVHVDMDRGRPFDALFIAASPVVMAAGLINWDFLAIALMSLAVWAWAKQMPVLTGVFVGLGVDAKLYPALLLVPLVALCVRTARWREAATVVLAAFAAWALPNGIVAATDFEAWTKFWEFNKDRAADLGSLWYVLKLAGHDIATPTLSMLGAVLNVVGALGVGLLALAAPRRPRLGQLAFLMVCWFLVVNKVYSPQYVLWLLPLVVLARPVLRDVAVWTIAELIYFVAIWGHLAGTTVAPGSTQDKVYWAAVLVRIAVEVWLMVVVVRDVLRPEHDPVRTGERDDPVGGVLDHARDVVRLNLRPVAAAR